MQIARRNAARASDAGVSTVRKKSAIKSLRVTVICLLTATTFTVFCTPYILLGLLGHTQENKKIKLPRCVMGWLALLNSLNSCVNPFLYGLMWRPFRKAASEVSRYYFSFHRLSKRLNKRFSTTTTRNRLQLC